MSHRKQLCWLLILVLLASGAVVAWKAKLLGRTYTAKAYLQIAQREPHILPRASEKYDPVEFEGFCDSQAALIKSPFVIIATLRDAKLKSLTCISDQSANHNAIHWLPDAIHVDFPSKNAGVMVVSTTEPDPQDAAAIVNAVVKAYMNEVVAADRQKREMRLRELQKIHAEKEVEVRT
jgi:uncharacterized protein involved in exopolysaccharide biosynthesis